MKQQIIESCKTKKMTWKEGAKLLNMHPKSLSRLKKNYLQFGVSVLVGKKPGPKLGKSSSNRTPEDVERLIVRLAIDHPDFGPIPLHDLLKEQYTITKDPTTIWRILKRREARYTIEYRRWKKDPQLYCLDMPGLELQLDACYPFGRSRKIVSFDAIDDCSRLVYGRCYYRENTRNAIHFVKELIKRVPFHIQRIRVDNRFRGMFKEYCETFLGIEVIVNDPYSPEQNGKIERFHKTLKQEFFWGHCSFQDSLEIINYKYQQWLYHYNYYRKHSGLGMNRMTPAQKIASLTLTMFPEAILSYPQKVTGIVQQYIA